MEEIVDIFHLILCLRNANFLVRQIFLEKDFYATYVCSPEITYYLKITFCLENLNLCNTFKVAASGRETTPRLNVVD